MSLIIKEQGGFNREVELSNEIGTIIKTIGVDTEMTNTEMIDALRHASVHMVAQGKQDEYQKLISAANEVQEWSSENVTVYF